MPRMTMLEMVQNLLSSASDFNVNSINDLEQSLQVAEFIKTEYYTLIDERDWSFLKGLSKLESLSDTNQPTKLKIPYNVNRITNLSYDVTKSTDSRTIIKDLCFYEPGEFLTILQSRDDSSSNVVTKTDSAFDVDLFFYNDRMPEMWTTFDNQYVYVDSYMATEESTINGNKTIIQTVIKPEFSLTDTFIPLLPENMFTLLLERSRLTSNYYLREMGDEIAQEKSKVLYNLMKDKEIRKDGGRKYAKWSRRR